MKLKEYSFGEHFICSFCGHDCKWNAVVGINGGSLHGGDGFCLQHLHKLSVAKPMPDAYIFIPQRVTGTLRDAVQAEILRMFPDALTPEPVKAPDKIGCRAITHSAEGIDANGYDLTVDDLREMVKRCEACKPETEYRWRFWYGEAWSSFFPMSYSTKGEAEDAYKNEPRAKASRRDYTLKRVLASNPDVEA